MLYLKQPSIAVEAVVKELGCDTKILEGLVNWGFITGWRTFSNLYVSRNR